MSETDITTPAQRIAELLHARRTGPNRWQARCPMHLDRTPSLSIRETVQGVCLVHCHAGCATNTILRTLKLRFGDLFPETTTISPAAMRAASAKRAQADRQHKQYHHAACVIAREVGRRERIVEQLGEMLAWTRDDDPQKDARVTAFHIAIGQLHIAEMKLASIEATLYRRRL